MGKSESTSDQRLIALLREGDLTALEALFRRHSRAIYGYFYRTTGSVAIGEELTQDVFVRVLRYHSSFEPRRAFRLWLYGIARNVLSDHRARLTTEATIEELEVEPISTAPLPTEQIERRESRELVHAALARLSEPERELLMLSRFQDLRHAELAELFGCTTGAIKVRVHRALKRFAAAIEALSAEVSR